VLPKPAHILGPIQSRTLNPPDDRILRGPRFSLPGFLHATRQVIGTVGIQDMSESSSISTPASIPENVAPLEADVRHRTLISRKRLKKDAGRC
jgi:hypothetical protein